MWAAHCKHHCSSRLIQSHQPCLQPLLQRRAVCRFKTLKRSVRVSAASEPPPQPQQQPNDVRQQQLGEAAAAAAAQPAAVQVGEQVAADAVLEHAGSSSPADQQHSTSHTMAATLYLALGGGLAAAGLLVATFAVPIAAGCLSLGSLPLQQAAALVGCCGAALLRAASLAVFIAVSADYGEDGCAEGVHCERITSATACLVACHAVL